MGTWILIRFRAKRRVEGDYDVVILELLRSEPFKLLDLIIGGNLRVRRNFSIHISISAVALKPPGEEVDVLHGAIACNFRSRLTTLMAHSFTVFHSRMSPLPWIVMKRGIRSSLLFVLLLLPLLGCVTAPSTEQSSTSEKQKDSSADQSATQAQAPQATEAPRYSGPIQFTDVTALAGIHFKHNSGAFGKKYLPETVGSGCAFIDYDNDGWQDILLINSTNWPDHKGQKSYHALYHNNHDGTFSNVTKEAGLAEPMHGLGCAVADYDN